MKKRSKVKQAERAFAERKALGLAIRGALLYAKIVVREELEKAILVIPATLERRILKRLMERNYYRHLGDIS